MIIGIPRERKTLEKRVALTPDGAHQLSRMGHTLLIEKDAGLGAAFPDSLYVDAGCEIVQSLEEVWTRSEMVVKVKEPHESEYQYFRPGLILFDYLHLASMPDVTKALMKGGVTSIAYELVKGVDNSLPLLEPMSEIAGKLSVINGSYYLLSQNNGRGVLLAGAVGVPRANVTIVGAGIAGLAACEMAYGLGAHVTMLDINQDKLEEVKVRFGNQVTTSYSTPQSLNRAISLSDLVIGAVLVPGAAAPKIITRDMLRDMPRGAVLVDISIDQGGCAETMKPTSLDDPVFVEEEIIHYGVCNMPSQTARTSTMALTSATLPYIVKMANEGPLNALKNDPSLYGALSTHKGKLTNKAVSEAVGEAYDSIESVL